MPTLMVVGCSFSDRTDVEKSYGDYLSEQLGYDYIHEGAGCGSNSRMWRKATNSILSGDLTSNDILIVQYTEPTRKEIWTSFKLDSKSGFFMKPRDRNYEHGGDIIRYKSLSAAWQPFKEEKQFLDAMEQHHIQEEFEVETAICQDFNFQHMLHHHQIPTIFVRALNYGSQLTNNYCNFDDFNELVYTKETLEMNNHGLSATDCWHLNSNGHKYIANELLKLITNRNIK